jgi:hypothetical protein
VATAEGKSAKFESEVQAVVPAVKGLELSVIGGDELLELRNDSGRTVIVKGYDNEPYLRFLPNGSVERNRVAPATYLNADRRGLAPIPKIANPRARPQWQRLSGDGRFRWFDHRIHITTKGTPRELRNVKVKKKVFNWTVPLIVDGRPARATGTLFFDPTSSSGGGFPVAAAVAVAVVAALVVLALAVVLRRRRRLTPRNEKAGGVAW